MTSRALAAAADRDDRVALRGMGTTLTYRALRERAGAIAAASRRWDGDERFVALIGPGTPEYIAAFLGLASAGWAVGVIDSSAPGGEVAGALDQLDPAVIVLWDRDRLGAAAAGPAWTPQPIDGEMVAYSRRVAVQDPAPADPDAPFYVGFTSGSSGRPKAFVRTHRSWCESFERFQEACPIPGGGRIVVPGPLSSSHFLFGVLHGLHVGATVQLGPTDDWQGVDAVFVVPTMLAAQAHAPVARDVPGPRYIFCAGAHLAPGIAAATRQRFPETALVEYYGASELSFVALRRHGDATPDGSVGRAFPGVEIQIVDAADVPVRVGEVGEIVVKSGLVFTGYRGRIPPGAAREREGGWLGVGDRGRLDADGYLFVAGRGSALIVSGGVNVQPEEVEELVTAVPGVAECAVVGVPDDRWGELVCAVLVLDPDDRVTRAGIRRHIAPALDRAKRPRRYVVIDRPLPMGRTGKVDRLAVRELISSGRELR